MGGERTIDPIVLDEGRVAALIRKLAAAHDRVLGPVVRDGVIAYDDLGGVEELPVGRSAEQAPGRYRLGSDAGRAWFAWAAPAESLKRVVHPPRTRVASASRAEDGTWTMDGTDAEPEPAPTTAVVGARACDLAGLDVLGRVFTSGTPDPAPGSRAPRTVVAVACTVVADTCFCASVDTGPSPRSGADVVLTELVDGDHRFVAEARTDRGMALLDELGAPVASDDDVAAATRAVAAAADAQVRHLDTRGLPGALRSASSSPRWADVAERCLTCGACTGVCPTCFCSTVEDDAALDGSSAERWQVWDSCFTWGFSELHGGSVRTSTESRYRQWLTHKLDTWFDQLGELGCVGCGRCIAWCPVGIDLVAEADAVRADPGGTPVSFREGS